jgi:hypothetical protein
VAVLRCALDTSRAHWLTKVQACGELPPHMSEAGSARISSTARRGAIRERDRTEVSRGRSSRGG